MFADVSAESGMGWHIGAAHRESMAAMSERPMHRAMLLLPTAMSTWNLSFI